MFEATLVILHLMGGATHSFVVEDDGVCETMEIMQTNGTLWVSDYGLPRQQPVSVECKCVLLDKEIEGEVL